MPPIALKVNQRVCWISRFVLKIDTGLMWAAELILQSLSRWGITRGAISVAQRRCKSGYVIDSIQYFDAPERTVQPG